MSSELRTLGEESASSDERTGVELNARRVAAILGAALLTSAAYLIHAKATWWNVQLETSDLWVFREGGRLVREGAPLYDHAFRPGHWTYPPFGALIMVPLTLIPVRALFPLSLAVNICALALMVALSFRPLVLRMRTRVDRGLALAGVTLVAIAVFPVADTLGLGQLGIVLTLMCLVDVVVLDRRRSAWQGALVGIGAAVKLTPAIFIVYYVVSRQWRAAVTATTVLLSCWTAAALLLPADTRTWIDRRIPLHVNDQIAGWGSTGYNQSLWGLVDGLPTPLPVVLWVLLVVPVLVVGLRAAVHAHRGGDLVAAASLVGLVGVLVSPISWHHHAVWCVPALGALVHTGRRRGDAVIAAFLTCVLSLDARIGLEHIDIFVIAYLVLFLSLARSVRSRTADTDHGDPAHARSAHGLA